jgi:hypothetical protein
MHLRLCDFRIFAGFTVTTFALLACKTLDLVTLIFKISLPSLLTSSAQYLSKEGAFPIVVA